MTDRPDEAAKANSEEEERQRIRRGIRYCLVVFLALRVGLTLVGLAGVAVLPHPSEDVAREADIPGPVGVPGWPAEDVTPGFHNVVSSWERFDGLWFLRIADSGYQDDDGSAVFFPLYPLVIRFVASIFGGGAELGAALLISNLAAFGAMVVLYFLTASEFDERIARRSVVYLAVFPTSFFLLAPYSESLFLLLVLTSLWAARRGRWELAGAAGAGASATRNLGVLLVLPLAVEAIHQFRGSRDPGGLARALVWSALAAAGTVAYLAFWQFTTGDALAPVSQQANWQRGFSPPWATLSAGTIEAFRFLGVYPGGYHLLDWLVVVPTLPAVLWAAVRTRPAFGVYVAVSLLAPLSYVFQPRPFMSLPRFLLPLFPILWAFAVWAGRRNGVHEAIVAFSATLLGILTILFLNWYYVF
ncbi:MAG TPA: mannosyltransferase family protein [Actinomycetota bacterium]|nr:mannosyltransferase family protein [Actinomycetota bacterium]